MPYILRRIAYALPVGIGVTIICFGLVYLGPGDPAQALIPDEASAADIEAIRAAYGFDKPLPIQYLRWLGRSLQGDFGVSLQSGRDVMNEVIPALVNTMRLAVVASILSLMVSLLLGGIAAYWRGSAVDRIVSASAIAGVSIPHYWLAVVLIIIFSVELNLLPAMGMGAGSSRDWSWNAGNIRAMVLPVICLSMIPIGIMTRSIRACFLEVLSQDYVECLRAKGLTGQRIYWHVARNAAPTILAVSGLQVGQLLGGSILVESVFSWPGTGFLLRESIFRRDLPVMQGTILVLTMIFVALNLIVDIAQSRVDPRIKRG